MKDEELAETPSAQDLAAGYDGAPVLLHVGLHKTATTWLQHQVLTPKDGRELVYCGDVSATHGAFIKPGFGDFRVADALARLADPIARAEASGLPLAFSDEALAGFPFHHKYYREITALRMKNTFPKARILITVREQCAVINSMYGEYLKYGYASTLRDFVAPGSPDGVMHPILDRSFYDYDRMLDFYEGLFGAGAVLIAPMEWLTGDHAGAAARLSALLGAEITPPEASLARTPRNEAWSDAAKAALRVLNRFDPQDSRWRRRGKGGWIGSRLRPAALAHRVDRLSKRLGGGVGARDKALVRAAIGRDYAASNRRLADRTGLDLAALGYPVD